jgi:hypothetical protein
VPEEEPRCRRREEPRCHGNGERRERRAKVRRGAGEESQGAGEPRCQESQESQGAIDKATGDVKHKLTQNPPAVFP